MTDLLPCVEAGAAPGEANASVIWLHGLGADGHDFVPILPMLGLPADSGIRFVFPHAPAIPVTVNGGMVMPAWYDIRGLDFDVRQDEEGIRRSAGQLRELVAREREAGIPSERIVVAGFSQGGAVALFEGLRHPEPLAGILALSTYLLCGEVVAAERSEANAAVPILQAHGNFDPTVVIQRGEAAREQLGEWGYSVEWHEYPMQHQVCEEEIAVVGRWLRERLVDGH